MNSTKRSISLYDDEHDDDTPPVKIGNSGTNIEHKSEPKENNSILETPNLPNQKRGKLHRNKLRLL